MIFFSVLEHARPGPFGPDETICDSIQQKVAHIRDHQKDYRNSVEDGRTFAEILNSRVGLFACLTTFGMIAVNLGQTIVLKRLFTPKKEHYGMDFKIPISDSPTW